MHCFAPFFNLKSSAKNLQHFFANEYWIDFPIFSFFMSNFAFFHAIFWWNFVRISRQIPEKPQSDGCRFFNRICENKLDNSRKFWNQWKLFIIIHYYSFVSLVAPSASTLPRKPFRVSCSLPASFSATSAIANFAFWRAAPYVFFLTPSEKLLITISLTSNTVFLTFSNFSEIIFWNFQKYSLRNSRKFENLGDFMRLWW